MARSSPNWLPTCVMNVPLGAARRNASSYCAARPPGSRSPRRGCGGSSAPTGWLRGRCEYGRTGCAIPYGTELACAGIDLLALRELMGHANPETTAPVHLSPETLAAENTGQGSGPGNAPAAITLRRQGAPDLLLAYPYAVPAMPVNPDAHR